MLTPQGQLVRGTHWLGAIGRMKPGVTVEEVQADMSTVARQMEQAYPDTNAGWGATVVPVLDQTVGTIRAPLLVLLAGVAFVLIIATVNVANLVLARSIARQKELATRVALGAGRAPHDSAGTHRRPAARDGRRHRGTCSLPAGASRCSSRSRRPTCRGVQEIIARRAHDAGSRSASRS